MISIILFSNCANAQSEYPWVFKSIYKLKEFGISHMSIIRNYNDEDISMQFKNRCYYYGDGGRSISVSNDFLNFYRLQGFSRRSLCLALISGIKYNPENGKHLVTYILMDPRWSKNGEYSENITEELPLSLPHCFSRGIPYSDCAWNYDPISGKKLSPDSFLNQRKFDIEYCRPRAICSQHLNAREIGQIIIDYLNGFSSENQFKCNYSEYKSLDPIWKHGMLANSREESYIECNFGNIVPDSERELVLGDKFQHDIIGWNSEATLFDFSPEFPKGFGYALYADGAAGSSVSAAVVQAALVGRKPPAHINPEALKKIWATGTK